MWLVLQIDIGQCRRQKYAGRNCIDSSQRNQPAAYKSATGTVNHDSDLRACEISLPLYVLMWQISVRLSVHDFVWQSVSNLTYVYY